MWSSQTLRANFCKCKALLIGFSSLVCFSNGLLASETGKVTPASNYAVLSSDARLSFLSLSQGTLTPAFAATTTSYTATVNSGVMAINITPVLADPTATIKVNGIRAKSGTASRLIALNVGPNIITTIVRAQNGVTTMTYTIIVTRAPSDNDKLSSVALVDPYTALTASTGNAFKNYTATVTNATSSIAVLPVSADAAATIKVNGKAVKSGTASQTIPLKVGSNIIATVVTAQDGTSTETYVITVTRPPSAIATLASIQLRDPYEELVFAQGPGFANYTASVATYVSTIKVLAVTYVPTATLKVDGQDVASGTISDPIQLNVGSNTITTEVIAQDGVTKKSYIITVTRAEPALNTFYQPVSFSKPTGNVTIENDGLVVHQGVSPNGDGINDFLQIDNINQYPDNKLAIMNRNGQLVYEASGYDNSAKVFDGHSNKNGQMQLPGTYFYQLDYTVSGITKHKTGFIVLKY